MNSNTEYEYHVMTFWSVTHNARQEVSPGPKIHPADGSQRQKCASCAVESWNSADNGETRNRETDQ